MTEKDRFIQWWNCNFDWADKRKRVWAWKAWQAARRWIPVIEDTPKVGDYVLGWTGGMHFIGMYTAGSELTDDDGICFEITHWQPLPKPPEDYRGT